MTPADRLQFLETVMGFAELKGKTLSAPALELYWRCLQRWSMEDFRAAAEHLVLTCKFMPEPKDFEDLRKAGRPTAGEAWERARKAAGTAIQCGQVTHNGTCGDELIDRAIRASGGYGAIAMCDTDKLHFFEKRFAEHYESIRDADDTREAVPQIAHQSTGPRLQGPQSAAALIPRLTRSA